ncbi:hypothetical protein ES705_31144 [subsurface metagenome]
MLRYKRIETGTLTQNKELIYEILSGLEGKRFKVVSISTAPLANCFLRVYRNAEQIVDAASIIMTDEAPILPMDLPVGIGQTVRVGFLNESVTDTAKFITIGYRDD